MSGTLSSVTADPILSGIWATPLLPLDENDQLRRDALARQVERLAASPVDGVYTNGTAAEFDMQTEEEFDFLSDRVARACRSSGKSFQIGVSHSSPAVMFSRLRRALRLKPACLQFILPAWSPLNDLETIDFCQAVARQAGGLPLVLYSPPHARRTLDAPMFGKIADAVPAIFAVKLMDGDAQWYEQMRHHAPRLALFVPGHRLASGFARGAAGSFSNVACINPSAAKRWHEQMKTDLPAAIEVERRIGAFMDQYIAPKLRGPLAFSNQAADKLLATVGGWADVGLRVRFPYRCFDPEYAAQLRPIAQRMIPEFVMPTL